MTRPILTTTWDKRYAPWENSMSIIQDWLYNDLQNWEDDKIWWDNWIIWNAYNIRTILNTNWN